MANATKPTGGHPIDYAGPAVQHIHPGVYYDNTRGILSDTPAVILRGPFQRNGTVFIDYFKLKNLEPVADQTDPINITLRLVNIPDDEYTSDNEYNQFYTGDVLENFDCTSMCPCSETFVCTEKGFYLKGDQVLVAYADKPDLVHYLIMFRTEI